MNLRVCMYAKVVHIVKNNSSRKLKKHEVTSELYPNLTIVHSVKKSQTNKIKK